MSGFKDMVADDVHAVFLNLDEFAEKRTIRYDGEEYQDIPIVLSGLKEQERRQLQSDHVQGLYLVSSVLAVRPGRQSAREGYAHPDQQPGGRRRILPGILRRLLGL